MIAIETYLNQLFQTIGVKKFNVKIMADGMVQVSDSETAVSCVNELFYSVEFLPDGLMRIKSQFYFYSPIKRDEDVSGDINPKMENIVFKIGEFIKELKKCPYNYTVQNGALNTYRGMTTSWETGIQIFATFDIPKPCN